MASSFEVRCEKDEVLYREWLAIERWLGEGGGTVLERTKAISRQVAIEHEREELGVEYDGDDKPIDVLGGTA